MRWVWRVFQAATFFWIWYEIQTRNSDIPANPVPFLAALACSWLATALIVDAISWPARIRLLANRLLRLRDKSSHDDTSLVTRWRHPNDPAKQRSRIRTRKDLR